MCCRARRCFRVCFVLLQTEHDAHRFLIRSRICGAQSKAKRPTASTSNRATKTISARSAHAKRKAVRESWLSCHHPSCNQQCSTISFRSSVGASTRAAAQASATMGSAKRRRWRNSYGPSFDRNASHIPAKPPCTTKEIMFKIISQFADAPHMPSKQGRAVAITARDFGKLLKCFPPQFSALCVDVPAPRLAPAEN